MNPLRWKLHWQILFSLLLAVGFTIVFYQSETRDSAFAIKLVSISSFCGDLFMRALKMIVVPLIMSSIIHGMIGLGADKNFGRLGLKTLAYYFSTGLIAICIGLLFVNIIEPGNVDDATRAAMNAQKADIDEFQSKFEGKTVDDIWDIFKRMIPTNIVEATSDNGRLLGAIVFSLLFGFFVTRLPEKLRETQVRFWDSIQQVMILLAQFIIAFAPIGVFGLVLPKLMATGFALFIPLAKFTATVTLALGTHFIIVMSLLLYFVARVNPLQHYKAMASALLTAWSTASSVSTLPVTIRNVQENAGVSKRISGFTLPLGATVNMDGTALYECVVVIFIAQFMGVPMDFTMQFTVVLLALVTSIGVAGIPSASLVAIVIILDNVGLDVEYIGIIYVVDRILDMCRTAVNIFSDSVGAVVIARTEGETNLYPGED